VPEIPRSQRFAARPDLDKLFAGSIIKERAKRDRIIREAVEKFGYTQRAVADYLGFHFTYISRILNER
jgi:putative transposase